MTSHESNLNLAELKYCFHQHLTQSQSHSYANLLSFTNWQNRVKSLRTENLWCLPKGVQSYTEKWLL